MTNNLFVEMVYREERQTIKRILFFCSGVLMAGMFLILL